MSLPKGQRRTSRSYLQREVVAPQSSRFANWLIPFALGAVTVGGGVYLAIADIEPASVPERTSVTAISSDTKVSPPSLGELALMSDEELKDQDIAALNLRCAEDLPGSEDLDIQECLATLDEWAAWVKHETDRHLYKYRNNPGEFENSEGFYRMMMLITVLQQDFKVHYNPERIREVDFTNSQDLFIHGMIRCENGGTCLSMPVLYTAIARRLGYPVSLVAAREHVFCRWDGSDDCFNIEATSQGIISYEDDYYMNWPKPVSQEEVERGLYLKSLDTSGSLAMFLAARGHCLEDNYFGAKARVAYAMAAEKRPQHPIYFGFLAKTMRPPSRPMPSTDYYTRSRPVESPVAYQPNPWANATAAGVGQPHSVSKPDVPNAPFVQQRQQTGIASPAGFDIQP